MPITYGLVKYASRRLYEVRFKLQEYDGELQVKGYCWEDERRCRECALLGPLMLLATLFTYRNEILENEMGFCFRMPPHLTEKYRNRRGDI